MKKNPALAVIFAAIIVILLLIGYYSAGTSIKETEEWDFKGVVEQVTKSLTNTYVITVSGKTYSLERLKIKPNIDIQKGDTVIKKKGDLMLKMIKPNTRDTIYCSQK